MIFPCLSALFIVVLKVIFGQWGNFFWTYFLTAMEDAWPLASALSLIASSTAPIDVPEAAETPAAFFLPGSIDAQAGMVFFTAFFSVLGLLSPSVFSSPSSVFLSPSSVFLSPSALAGLASKAAFASFLAVFLALATSAGFSSLASPLTGART
jgi:hypothetical protein